MLTSIDNISRIANYETSGMAFEYAAAGETLRTARLTIRQQRPVSASSIFPVVTSDVARQVRLSSAG
jgi:hypothetical protein